MIIFLYGLDTFRSREKLNKLKTRFISEVDRSGLNLAELDGSKMSADDFRRAVFTQSFLASKRMVAVKGVLARIKSFQTEILEILKKGKFIEDGKEDNILIFLDEKVDKRSALFKYLNTSKIKEEFNVLESGGLAKWAEDRVIMKKGKINRQNSALLASRSDGNLWVLASEIDKLAAMKNGDEIVREDVENTAMVKLDDNIFNLCDAIANRNKKLGLKLVDEQLGAGVNDIYLLTMIVRQFRILIQVKVALEAGGGNNRQIAGSLGLHPFVVQKAIPQANSYEMSRLREIYGELLEIDEKLKMGGDGRVLIETFVAKS